MEALQQATHGEKQTPLAVDSWISRKQFHIIHSGMNDVQRGDLGNKEMNGKHKTFILKDKILDN